MEDVKLDIMELIDSVEIMRTYKRLRLFWSKELAIELLRIYKSINYLRDDLEKLREEVEKLKGRVDRPERELVWA